MARAVLAFIHLCTLLLLVAASRIDVKQVQTIMTSDNEKVLSDRGSCKPFGSSNAKTCTGNLIVFPQIFEDQFKCAELCEGYATHTGDACCIFLSDHRCAASAGGEVVDTTANETGGLATTCTALSAKGVPDWQMPRLGNDRKNLLNKAQTIGSTPEERRARTRATELAQESDFMEPALFRAITARGVMQGQLGDCWLIAAISSFARFPNAVQALFPQQSVLSKDGEYEVQLYNIADHAWVTVAVNDLVEANGAGGAKKAKVSHTREIWPVILEKAFAKLVNRNESLTRADSTGAQQIGYDRLNGGIPAWGVIALTGNEIQWQYSKRDDGWIPQKLDSSETANSINSGNPTGYKLKTGGIPLINEQMWAKIQRAMASNYLMTAAVFKTVVGQRGSGANGEVLRTDGIFEGHAYSVLNAVQIVPGEDLEVCQEEVDVLYSRPEDLQAMQARMDGSRFRGWGVGDIVWAHFLAGNHSKAKSLLRFRVSGIEDANSTGCEGEPCVSYDMNPSPEDQGIQKWAGRPLLPLSWIVGSRQGSHTKSHGVRPGWWMTRQYEDDKGSHSVFNGIVDRAICEDPGDRRAGYARKSVPSIQQVTRLVRVRNPWGNGDMYNGMWSDYDLVTWREHPDLAQALNFIPAPDGTWWMDYESFAQKFQMIGISEMNMAVFDPPPPSCNTNWGATQYLPAGPDPLPLDWTKATQQPALDQCAWCVALDRGHVWSSESCSKAFGDGVDVHKAHEGRKGTIKLCCAVVDTAGRARRGR